MTGEAPTRHLTRNRGVGLLVALLAVLGVLIAPAAAASSAPTVEQDGTISGTWEGQVERHGDHFDYIGSPCPIESEVCITVVVTYEIVPTTDQAREALPTVAGQRAELVGTLHKNGDEEHDGTLFVEHVSPTSH